MIKKALLFLSENHKNNSNNITETNRCFFNIEENDSLYSLTDSIP